MLTTRGYWLCQFQSLAYCPNGTKVFYLGACDLSILEGPQQFFCAFSSRGKTGNCAKLCGGFVRFTVFGAALLPTQDHRA